MTEKITGARKDIANRKQSCCQPLLNPALAVLTARTVAAARVVQAAVVVYGVIDALTALDALTASGAADFTMYPKIRSKRAPAGG